MTTPQAPTDAPASGGGGGRSLVARVGGPRNAAIIGAGLTVGVVALIGNMRSKSAAANGTTTTITGDTAFDSGPYDMWNQWQEEYEDLQEQVNASQAGTTTGSGPGNPPKSTLPAPVKKPPIPKPAPKPKPPKPKPKPPTHHKPKPKPKPKPPRRR